MKSVIFNYNHIGKSILRRDKITKTVGALVPRRRGRCAVIMLNILQCLAQEN